MLLIVGLSAQQSDFPTEALKQVDSSLAILGFRKEVSSLIRPRKEYSITYEGAMMEKTKIEELLRPIAQQYNLTFTVELEESVRFP